MRRGRNNYHQIQQAGDQLSQQVEALKEISQQIKKKLKDQEKVRSSLSDYLDLGYEALQRTNNSIKQLMSSRSLFGCNSCILLGITLLVILILSFI